MDGMKTEVKGSGGKKRPMEGEGGKERDDSGLQGLCSKGIVCLRENSLM